MDNPTKESGTADGHVLIVEDSQTQAAQLQYILEKHGFPVSAAARGTLTLLGREENDQRHHHAGNDGFELCRRIKASEETRDIPVILLTSLSDPQDVIKGGPPGADNFITKALARIRHMRQNRKAPGTKAIRRQWKSASPGRNTRLLPECSRILDFLLSTYETAIQKNRELLKARDELNASNDQLAATVKNLKLSVTLFPMTSALP